MSESYKPDNDSQLVELVQSALTNDSTISISGQNTKTGFGYTQQTELNINMTSFNGIINYDPAELVMQAKAGTALSDIEAALSEHKQHLAFEPPSLGKLYDENPAGGTIGGVFMGNLSGPRRFIAGAARDHILGIKAVSGRGEIYKSGGNVIKNVTGYDMSKLLTGSWGTLSIVTELSFKVLPAPPTSCSIIISGIEAGAAMDLLSKIAQSPLQSSGLAFIPANTLKTINHEFISTECQDLCVIRLEGSSLSVRERSNDLKKLLAKAHNINYIEEDSSKLLWQLIRDPDKFMSNDLAPCIVKLSIPPAQAKKTIKLLSTLQDCHWYVDAAGGWLWVNFHKDNAVNNIQILRHSLVDTGGSVVLYKAPEKIKQEAGIFSNMGDALMSLTLRLKNSFDPANVLNPNRLFINR
ncbi:MAG: FAD-binding protein [Gammaproteobacteria bacterium]|jgi:glycolate oxidase FAD binding subunit|nr:FAD-binding protein [Gammaproteobacteria bacterium]